MGEEFPAGPVVFGHAILDRVDGELSAEAGEIGDVFGSCFTEVEVVFVECGGSAVESEGDVGAGSVAGEVDSLDEEHEGSFVGGEMGGKASFVPDSGWEILFFEEGFEGVKDFGAPAHSFGKGGGADRADHEFLEVK